MNPIKLNLSTILKGIPGSGEITFLKQMGIRYVHVWLEREQIRRDILADLKEKLMREDIILYMVGCLELGKSDRIHLNLPGRDGVIGEFQRMVRLLGELAIPVTVFTWEPTRVWSSSPGETRGAKTRYVDLDELKRRPFTHERRFTRDELWDNFAYFLERIIPIAQESGVMLACHPNDPPADEYGGVPCLINSRKSYERAFSMAAGPALGMEFCCGCWLEGGKDFGDILEGLKYFLRERRIGIVHFRNVSSPLPRFTETFLDNGYFDMYSIIKILQEHRYEGTITMDHTPELTPAAGGLWGGEAYAVGYMRALCERAASECR